MCYGEPRNDYILVKFDIGLLTELTSLSAPATASLESARNSLVIINCDNKNNYTTTITATTTTTESSIAYHLHSCSRRHSDFAVSLKVNNRSKMLFISFINKNG